MEPTIKQVAALPYCIDSTGAVQVLLITSRETRRWIIPKGNRIRGLEPHQAAAHEAFEEGGISGIACPMSLGSYHYGKHRADGSTREASVDVFPLAFLTQFEDWPEQDQRQTKWFSLVEAAAVVDEPELKTIITDFRQPSARIGLAETAVTWVRQRGSEKVPILRWFQALMPKQGRFFELFEAHSRTLVDGADALARMLEGGDTIAEYCRAIGRYEDHADAIARDVLQDVRRTFVTPFDRSAITSLINAMDDAIDQMNQTAKTITLYEVHEFEPRMQDMTGLIVEAARITSEAVPLLRSVNNNGNRLHLLTERIIRIEDKADEIHDAGVKALFKEYGATQPMQFIVQREIYSHLERVVDRFEDVANEIEGLVIDHA